MMMMGMKLFNKRRWRSIGSLAKQNMFIILHGGLCLLSFGHFISNTWANTNLYVLRDTSRDHCILGQAFNTLSPPISDAFDNIDYFFCILQMVQLWHYWEIACWKTINNIFFHCYKKHLKWRDKLMKNVSPIIQCRY